ncbi:SDR family NAD(P)-dependent oxidoreductase [Rhodococcus opacus]|uniref:SDR family NAD(P)-dependent oxidoreductase n=1 Tax=Rhodococcus opacus TaxID=37919 RepID=UPI001C4459C6|nr:SDR family oxidoreductase [Rhodococcus opacus]MBV6754860.1 SDR family oxidoreductase [Rhodococcus opacus]
MGKLDHRTAIVSGSGRGIGREIALKLASEGARVVVNDLDAGPAEDTVAAVRAIGGEAVTCVGSVTEDDFAQRFVDTALDAFGGLDIIVNNAGYYWNDLVEDLGDEQWDAILDVNLRAPFRILRAAQPVFRNNRVEHHRKVVNISSNAGLVGNERQANYSSAKSGVVGLTKALAREWGRYRVNVNAVAFGWISTRLTEPATAGSGSVIDVDGRAVSVGLRAGRADALLNTIPLGRAGTAEEAAGAVYLLCTPESDYISGQCLACDAGRN